MAKASRAIWKGGITLPSARVPVKVHAALQDRTVRFRLLHAPDEQPVVQRMVEPRSDTVVSHDDIARGLPTEDGAFVIVHSSELEELEPQPSRDIEVLRFVPRGAVDLPWYDRPYWLSPDGHEEAYAALVRALEETDREGIVRWVMRKRDYVGSLFAREHRLALVTLHYAEEVIPAAALPRPGGPDPTAKEIELARQLVGALEDTFDPTDHEDEYRTSVLELIDEKARGGTIELKRPPKAKKPAEEPSLTQMLEASLKGGRRKGKRVA
jgi:DNA end-binding protein Ku